MTIGDKHIIDIVRTNPESGFRLLLTKYKKPIYWHIRRIVVGHDDAQDAAQETFVRVFRNFSSCKSGDKLRGWIFRIATNEALRMLDKRKSTTLSLDDEVTNIAGQTIADPYFDNSDKAAVMLQKAILSLPTKQQLTFNLRYYDEMAYDEIAEVIGSTASATKMNYHIAKDKIVKFINSNDL